MYHHECIIGDYDEFDDVDKLIAFIRTGQKMESDSNPDSGLKKRGVHETKYFNH